MTVPNGAILRAAARFNAPTFGDIVNVYHLVCAFTTAQGNEDVFDAVNAAISSIYAAFDDHIAADCDPADLKVDIVEWDSEKFAVVENIGFGSWGSTVLTTGTGDKLPAGVTALIKIATLVGKHFGRKFVGSFTEVDNGTGGGIATGLLTALLTGFANMLTTHVVTSGNNIAFVVPDTTDGTFRYTQEVLANNQWSFQRRRRPGVGS